MSVFLVLYFPIIYFLKCASCIQMPWVVHLAAKAAMGWPSCGFLSGHKMGLVWTVAFQAASSNTPSQINADFCDPFRSLTTKEGIVHYDHTSDSFMEFTRTFEWMWRPFHGLTERSLSCSVVVNARWKDFHPMSGFPLVLFFSVSQKSNQSYFESLHYI